VTIEKAEKTGKGGNRRHGGRDTPNGTRTEERQRREGNHRVWLMDEKEETHQKRNRGGGREL